jgi:hypothetical protein
MSRKFRHLPGSWLIHYQADLFTPPADPTLYAYSPRFISVPSDGNENVLGSGCRFLDSANPKLPGAPIYLSKTGWIAGLFEGLAARVLSCDK